MQRDAKGYLIDRHVHLSPVGPVHVREEEDPAKEEGNQDENPVDLMQQGILHFQLSTPPAKEENVEKVKGEASADPQIKRSKLGEIPAAAPLIPTSGRRVPATSLL